LIPELTGKSIVNGFVTRATTQFVTSTGEVWGAGYNYHGSLGIGTSTNDQMTFQRARLNSNDFVTNAVAVYIMWEAGVGLTSYILLSDKTVLSAGNGNGGRLGDGDTGNHQRNFFQPVLKAANTPLTNVTKLQLHVNGVGFLDTTSNVWFIGNNADGIWGNGEDNGTKSGWATIKQIGIVDLWMPVSAKGWVAGFYLKADLTLWATGTNTDYQLGVVQSGEVAVLVLERVALPRDEYPIKIKRAGAVGNDGTAYLGTLFLTQKGNIYYTGRTVGINPDSLNNTARFPRLIIDNLINEQTRTL
jgi:alpha-tubulin suppressor-like RCC1 family protein